MRPPSWADSTYTRAVNLRLGTALPGHHVPAPRRVVPGPLPAARSPHTGCHVPDVPGTFRPLWHV